MLCSSFQHPSRLMLEVHRIRKTFSSIVAVDDVSFDVRQGEILGLIGPNGAGKTTTIRTILNILKPDGGTIVYRGEKFSKHMSNGFGYLPEERGLYRRSRVLDAMKYFAELRGMDRASAGRAACSWLDTIELRKESNRRIEELSKGNQQKVQFAVTLVHDPWLVVLDEPLSGLDPINQELLKGILLDLKRKGKAIIFSTHQMEHAEQLSDHLCLINEGKMVLKGTLQEIQRQHRRNLVRVEFEGNGTFVDSLKGVVTARISSNTAEVELSDDLTPGEFLRQITNRLEVHSFRLVEPSLQSIFLDVVGGKENIPS
jgi:ABC-2 type transport system ATP-binding protein